MYKYNTGYNTGDSAVGIVPWVRCYMYSAVGIVLYVQCHIIRHVRSRLFSF